MTDRLTYRLTDWLTDWLTNWLTGRTIKWPTTLLTDCTIASRRMQACLSKEHFFALLYSQRIILLFTSMSRRFVQYTIVSKDDWFSQNCSPSTVWRRRWQHNWSNLIIPRRCAIYFFVSYIFLIYYQKNLHWQLCISNLFLQYIDTSLRVFIRIYILVISELLSKEEKRLFAIGSWNCHGTVIKIYRAVALFGDTTTFGNFQSGKPDKTLLFYRNWPHCRFKREPGMNFLRDIFPCYS